MKKLSKLLALAAGLASLFFASCSDLNTENATVSQGMNDQTNNARVYTVSFAAANGSDIPFSSIVGTEDGSERTIVATDQVLANYNYYLWGTNLVTGVAVAPKKVDFTADTDLTKGSVTLDLSVSNYKLVLAAVKNDFSFTAGTTTGEQIKTAALYVGYANVDLRNTTSIKFYITTEGLTGDADFDLSIMYDGLTPATGTWLSAHKTLVSDATKYTIGAYIEKRTDGSLLFPTGLENKPTANIDNAKFFDGTTDNIAKLTGSVAPGTYNLVVAFTKVGTTKTYYWSDTIILLPKQKVTSDVKVPDVIEYEPAAPENLKIGFVTPSTSDIGTYTAVAKWDDKSSNETHFQIEIVDVSSKVGSDDNAGISTITAAVDDAAKWGTAVENITDAYKTTYAKDFYGDSKNGWVAGSLQKNNSQVAFRLSLGTTYLIRIAAVNEAGTSTYAYATYDLTSNWTDPDTYHSSSYDAKPFSIKNIANPFAATDIATVYAPATTVAYCVTANLFRLTYHLNGGTLTVADSKTTTADCVYYLCDDPTNGIAILAPYNKIVASSQVYPTLINDGNRWTSWRKDIVEGTMYDSDADNTTETGFTFYKPKVYKKFKNIDLYASYTVASAEVEAYLDKNYNFEAGEVALTTSSSVLKTTDYAYTVYTTSNISGITAAESIAVNYTLKSSRTAFTYSSLFATITRNGKSYAKADFSSGACSFNVKNLPADGAVYQLTVFGEYKGHQYSYPITLTLQDAVSAP